MGRRSLWKARYIEDVRCMQGLNKGEIAQKLGVSRMTLHSWMTKYPDFASVVEGSCKTARKKEGWSVTPSYQKEFCDKANEILSSGGNLKDVARVLHTSPAVVRKWIREHPEFSHAIENGQLAKLEVRQLRPGRPEVPFLDQYVDTARDVMKTGATMERLAIELGVSLSLLKNWVKENPKLKAAIEEGRAVADSMVATSLFRRAVGYTYEEEVVETVTGGSQADRALRRQTTKHLPGDPRAQELWLRNRKPEDWSRGSSGEQPPSVGVLIGQMSPEQVESADRVVEYLDARKK